MGKHAARPIDPEAIVRVRAEIAAEVAAIRAAGGEVHGCDFDGPEDVISAAEAKVMIAEWNAAQRVRFPGKWIGDEDGDRREASMNRAIVRDHIKAIRAERAAQG
jgi:hypothetical protein